MLLSRYAERAINAYATRDDSRVAAARALRARILFRSGREDEAMADRVVSDVANDQPL